MTLLPSRRSGRLALGAITSLSLSFTLLSAAPMSAAAPVKKSVRVNHQCVEDKGIGSNGSLLTLSPDNVAVEYPETVLPGQTFTVKVQPGGMRTGGKDTGRMKYDIALPQGVKISNLRLDGGASGLNANPAAVVQRVDASGKPNANGAFARIWDGANSVNNGGNENDQWYNLLFVSVPRAGLAVDRNKSFRLPRIAFDVTAPTTVGSKIVTGLRAAGTSAGPAGKENRDNTLSMLAKANVADAVYCTADAAGKTLTSTTVALRDTQTEFDETSTDLEVTSGEGEVTLKALVKGTDGQPITEGKVEFDLGDGQRRTVDVRDGVAELRYTYAELADRESVKHKVVARYLGVEGRTGASEATTTVTVNPKPRTPLKATVDLTGEVDATAPADGKLPLNLRAAVGAELADPAADPDADTTLEDGVEVVFFNGDQEIGRAKTANGVAELQTTVPDEPATLQLRAVVADFENETQEVSGAEDTLELKVAPVAKTTLRLDKVEPALVGEKRTLSARYEVSAGSPEGAEVIFRANGIRVGTAQTDAEGNASVEHGFEQAGLQKITAEVREREVDGRVFSKAVAEPVTFEILTAKEVETGTTLTREDVSVDLDATPLTGDAVAFTAKVTVEGDEKITEGATVSFFDGEEFLGTAPVNPTTGEARFEYRFPTRGEHQVRAVFGGQEVVNDEGVVTAVLKPSASEELTVEVKAHEIEVEDTPGAGDGNGGNNGDDQNQGGSDGSDMGSTDGSILRKLLIALGAIGVISAVIAAVMHVLHQR
ncbi:Ig-like domain-containing protein [Corynebacterium sp. MSK039]|uniref:Ig-like domain-containing protein n=1 Tax=Corynebacterium sp. MSK039 TaxID=3050193 RepID=UPI00255013B1|nr:Ig-like domain-containing protein [Corynebacterium sp. MSK039]MDK8791130.1 Ig-like domain-containing protein [Corynebacterium sp. MSK039]